MTRFSSTRLSFFIELKMNRTQRDRTERESMTTQPTGQIPKPVFILQNSKPVTNLLYSSGHENLLYAGNREGDLTVYDLELRRTVFTSNSDHQPVQGLLELDDHNLLAFSRSGAIFKWNLDSPNSLTQTCKLLLTL